MRHPAVWNSLHHTLLPPRFEVLRLGYRPRVLNPLDHLGHGYKVDVVVVRQDLIDPEEERVQELGVVLQPSGVEVQPERGAVLFVMTVEIVVEEIVELVACEDVGARVDHSATRQVLVVVGVFSSV